MTDWMLLILAIALSPFLGFLGFGGLLIYYYYCPIQLIALLIIYFLRKIGILTFGSSQMHYILGFIIGHIVYVVVVYQGIMHRGFMP